jgi:hypothetical protein
MFFFVSNESVGRVCDSGSLIIKMACGKNSGVRKVIYISFGLGEGVLKLRLVISFISLCILSSCLDLRVLKFSISIFSIWT